MQQIDDEVEVLVMGLGTTQQQNSHQHSASRWGGGASVDDVLPVLEHQQLSLVAFVRIHTLLRRAPYPIPPPSPLRTPNGHRRGDSSVVSVSMEAEVGKAFTEFQMGGRSASKRALPVRVRSRSESLGALLSSR